VQRLVALPLSHPRGGRREHPPHHDQPVQGGDRVVVTPGSEREPVPGAGQLPLQLKKIRPHGAALRQRRAGRRVGEHHPGRDDVVEDRALIGAERLARSTTLGISEARRVCWTVPSRMTGPAPGEPTSSAGRRQPMCNGSIWTRTGC